MSKNERFDIVKREIPNWIFFILKTVLPSAIEAIFEAITKKPKSVVMYVVSVHGERDGHFFGYLGNCPSKLDGAKGIGIVKDIKKAPHYLNIEDLNSFVLKLEDKFPNHNFFVAASLVNYKKDSNGNSTFDPLEFSKY